MIYEHGGTIERIENGAFKDSGTMVATVLVNVKRPKDGLATD